MGLLTSAYKALLAGFIALFEASGNFSITNIVEGGSAQKLEAALLAIAMVICLIGISLQAAKAAWTRTGEPIATAIKGLFLAVLYSGAGFLVVAALFDLANALTVGIINTTAGSTTGFATDMATVFAIGLLSPALAIVSTLVLIIGVIAMLILWVELLLRGLAIVLLTLMIPVSASGLVAESTRQWHKKSTGMLLTAIFVKPIIAIIFATGFLLTDSFGRAGLTPVLMGMLTLLVACFAWPVLSKFLTFSQSSAGGLAAGAAIGGALGVSGGALMMSGRSNSSSSGASMESANSRNVSMASDAVGGIGPSAALTARGASGTGASGASGAGAGAGGGLMLPLLAMQAAQTGLHGLAGSVDHAAALAGHESAGASVPPGPSPVQPQYMRSHSSPAPAPAVEDTPPGVDGTPPSPPSSVADQAASERLARNEGN